MWNRETATMVDNGKERHRAVHATQVTTDIKALIDGLVASSYEADKLLEILAPTGIVSPLLTVQNILARRYGAGVSAPVGNTETIPSRVTPFRDGQKHL